MSFFVVERDAAAGSLLVPVSQLFATREAALEALAAAVATGAAVIEGEVFVVDLATAVPVLVMPSAAPPPTTGAEPSAADVPGQEVYAAWAEAVVSDDAEADAGLADALKRAASTLESEGIVAPASIDAEAPAAEANEWASGAPAVVAEPLSALESEVPPASEEPSDESLVAEVAEPESTESMADLSAALEGLASADLPAAPADGESWPWANVAPVDEDAEASPVQGGEDRDLVAETVASLEDTGAEDVSLLTPVLEGEEAFLPKPVILGDYDETPAPPVEIEATLAGLGEDDAVLEYVPQAPEEDDDLEESVDEAPPEPDAAVESDPVGAEEAVVAVGYEAGSDLDLQQNTCNDCVYSNTCPKVDQSTPAECGSFQWRSE